MNYKQEIKEIGKILLKCSVYEQIRRAAQIVTGHDVKVVDTKVVRRYSRYSSDYDLLILCDDLDSQGKVAKGVKIIAGKAIVDKIVDNMLGVKLDKEGETKDVNQS